MRGSKILITGATGQVATLIALASRADNEVGGARFTDPAARERLEQAGSSVRGGQHGCRGLHRLPADFDYVLNFAVAKSGGGMGTSRSMRVRRPAHVALPGREGPSWHCSSGAVYDPPNDEPGPNAPFTATTTRPCSRPTPSPRSPERSSSPPWRAPRYPGHHSRLNVPLRRQRRLAALPPGDDAQRHTHPGACPAARPSTTRSTGRHHRDDPETA